MNFIKTVTLTTTLLLSSSLCMAESITGAGSTFGAPIYGKWAEGFKTDSNIELNYQAVGSGAGINQINNRTVDFGASDMPVSEDKLLTNHLVQIPTVMGAVVVIVNIPGVNINQLHISNDVISDIYLGNIKYWNDPAIQADNPLVILPKLAIAPVYRADGSGTTYVFTGFLSKINQFWNSNIGSSTSVKWPVGTGGKGNDGISSIVHQVNGAIGYVESAYASVNKLTTVQMQSANHTWISPTSESFTNAAKQADWAHTTNFAIDLLEQPGNKSWPIVSATFLLIPDNAKDPNQTKAVIKWIRWSYINGTDTAEKLEYIPLPMEVQKQVLDKLKPLE